MTAHMTKALGGNKELMDAMIPKFPVGCRRLTPGVGYLESLGKENVRVVTQGITKITEKSFELTSGEVVEVDAIICATGFDVSFCPRFPIIGRKGNLQDTWTKELPSAYMSCAVTNVPNYFGMPSLSYIFSFLCLIPKALLLILLLYSIPGTERPDWSWQCPHHLRACGQIYRRHAEKVPDRGHQSGSAEGRCCSRLQRAHPRLHATDFLVWQLSVVVQERHG